MYIEKNLLRIESPPQASFQRYVRPLMHDLIGCSFGESWATIPPKFQVTKTRQVMLGAYFTFIHSIPSCPFLTLSFSFKTSNLACVLIYFHSPSLHYMFRLFSHASLSRSLSNLFNPRIFQPCPFYDHFRFNLVPYIPQDFS